MRALAYALGLAGPSAPPRRRLPWRPSVEPSRAGEDVRPIFWANRPASYVERTASWRHFPSGRWAGAAEPRFGDSVEEAGAEALTPGAAAAEALRAVWGEDYGRPEDVWEVFAAYIEGRVGHLPWCEASLHAETSPLTAPLARLNRAGFLTINSQPRLNGELSTHPVFGWGPPGGFVYQKAYIECFADARHLAALAAAAARHATVTFQAVNVHGKTLSNAKSRVRRRGAGGASCGWEGGGACG